MPRKTRLLIEFDTPRGVPHAELREFIIDALETWGGQRHPDDPLFGSLENVKISKPITLWGES